MLTITLIQLVVFLLYISLVIHKVGVLESISDSWYQMKPPWNHLFTAFCTIIGFLMLFQTNGTSAFFFLSGAGLIFTGVATQFKEDMAKSHIVHYVGAFVGIIAALAGLWYEYDVWIPSIMFAIGVSLLYVLIKIDNAVWWLEIWATFWILIGLVIR